MSFKEIIQLPYKNFLQFPLLMVMIFLSIVVAAFYPSSNKNDYSSSRNSRHMLVVMMVEDYARYINTALPLVTTIVLKDWTGMKQLVVLAVSTTLSTHIPKRVMNNVEVNGIRLGERPNKGNHNMPSGHSSEASMGGFFMIRRYSKWFGIIVLPILVLTMYTRYILDQHTVSATIAGALIGLLIVLMFSTNLTESRKKFK
jgi:membrane-associated phospholipid phosphatase